MERTHQVSRHHTRLIISAQMPMFLLRRVRSRLALSVGFGMSAIRSASGGQIGKQLLTSRLTGFDPEAAIGTLADHLDSEQFRSAPRTG
jgi:hypothetical protein